MSDFHQFGLISTLHRIGDNGGLEKRLEEFSEKRQVGLVLPCHFEDLQQPAMRGILGELAKAKFLARLVLVTNSGGHEGYALARHLLESLPMQTTIIAADCAPVSKWLQALPVTTQPGKGLNVWLGIGALLQRSPQVHTVAVHDCDIVGYDRDLLARLCVPVTDPVLDYAFAKGYYRRASGRLFGRVSRLFMIPLLQALGRVLGHSPLLDFFESFRYPLSGEIALSRELANALPVAMDWGLETAMLTDVFQQIDPDLICQVDLGAKFEHKHQPLGSANASTGLARMCCEISLSLFDALAREGVQLEEDTLIAICKSYEKAAALTLRRYRDVARFNDLETSSDEEEAVNVFGAALNASCKQGRQSTSALPSWSQLARSEPQLVHAFAAIDWTNA